MKKASVEVQFTPSLLYSNLTSDGLKLAYSHRSDVCIVNLSGRTQTKVPFGDSHTIVQVKWCQVNDRWYLAIATTNGLQMWDAEGRKLLFHFHLSSEIEISDGVQSFSRGITAVRHSEEICAGSSNGDIFVFKVQEENIALSQVLKFHTRAITCLASSTNHVAAADDNGTISLWSSASLTIIEEAVIEGFESPCTSVVLNDQHVIAGYSTGHIKIFQISTSVIRLAIAAHVRCINAIDLHPSGSMFVSVAEDSMVNVWKLPDSDEKKDGEVKLVKSIEVPNSFLTGVAFLPPGRIAVAAYDFEQIMIFD